MKYFAILGTAWRLAAAELDSVLPRWQGRLTRVTAPIAWFEAPADFDVDQFLALVGGTIKIGVIRQTVLASELTARHLAALAQPVPGKKFHFGISIYPLAGTSSAAWSVLGKAVKQELQAGDRSVRHVTSHEPVLSSVTVAKNRLLKNGVEYCLIVDGQTVQIGTTAAVQRVGEYTRRDADRPGRNAARGMLPPKVAQMMLNFAQVQSSSVVLDPFCGGGTIVQEALLAGVEQVIGTDHAAGAITDTTKNMAALRVVHPQLPLPRLVVADARQLSRVLPPASVDAIVTEPLLGPPLSGTETTTEVTATIRELSALYRAALANWTKILKPGSTVVIIFPIIATRPSMSQRDLARLAQLGYVPAWPLAKETVEFLSDRHSLTYQRAGQRLAREIFVWRYK